MTGTLRITKDDNFSLSSESKIVLWLFAIFSFWITRLYNPLSFFGVKPGDYRLYAHPVEKFSTEIFLSSEAFVQQVYSFGRLVFFSEILFSFFLFLLIYNKLFYFFNRSSAVPIFTKAIIIFNPMYILFLSYPSKETLLTLLILYLYKIFTKQINIFSIILMIIFLIPIFYIRNFYVIPLLYLFFLKIGFGRFHFILVVSISTLLYFKFTQEIFASILSEIAAYFIGYLEANTTRFWVNLNGFSSPFELGYYLILGIYTIFFAGLPSEIIKMPVLGPLFVIGFFKIHLLYKLLTQNLGSSEIRRYQYFILLVLFVLFPLSIYNIGSSIRYQIPLIFLLTVLYGNKFILRYREVINK